MKSEADAIADRQRVSILEHRPADAEMSLGKLRLRSQLERFVPEQLGANGFRLLEVDLGDVSRIVGLPVSSLSGGRESSV